MHEQFEYSDEDEKDSASDDRADDEWCKMVADLRKVEARANIIAQHLDTLDRSFDKFTDIHVERYRQLATKVQMLAECSDARCKSAEARILSLEGFGAEDLEGARFNTATTEKSRVQP